MGWFDLIIDDDMFGEKTPEKAERRFLTEAVGLAMDKVSLEYDAINYFLAGRSLKSDNIGKLHGKADKRPLYRNVRSMFHKCTVACNRLYVGGRWICRQGDMCHEQPLSVC